MGICQTGLSEAILANSLHFYVEMQRKKNLSLRLLQIKVLYDSKFDLVAKSLEIITVSLQQGSSVVVGEPLDHSL